jgi:adenine-specific DNA methylase
VANAKEKTASLKQELQKFVSESGRDDIEVTLASAVLHILDHMDGTVDAETEEEDEEADEIVNAPEPEAIPLPAPTETK